MFALFSAVLLSACAGQKCRSQLLGEHMQGALQTNVANSHPTFRLRKLSPNAGPESLKAKSPLHLRSILCSASGSSRALALSPAVAPLRTAAQSVIVRRRPTISNLQCNWFFSWSPRAQHTQGTSGLTHQPFICAHRSSTALTAPMEQPERALQLSAFVFAVALGFVQLAPTDYLLRTLGVVSGQKLLIAVGSLSALFEIIASPIIGGLADSVGRKPVLSVTLATSLLCSLAVCIAPVTATVSICKFLHSSLTGIFLLSSGAILADNYNADPNKLGAASGSLFACVSAGFGIGVAVSGLLPLSLRGQYACSCGMSCLSLVTALSTVRESILERVPFKARAFNPFAFTRLLTVGKQMRWLAFLEMLTHVTLYMGETLQVYAQTSWKLTATQFSRMFTGFAASGVIANSVGANFIKVLGLRPFVALATISTLLFWVGFASGSLKVTIACMIIGVLGPARSLGTITMMSNQGAKLGIPQGQLSGDRSNLNAWLKVIGPYLYGQLSLHGWEVGVPEMPFYLNVAFSLAALGISPVALRGEGPVREQSVEEDVEDETK